MISAWDVVAILGLLTFLVLLAEYAGKIGDWLNRVGNSMQRTSKKGAAVPTVLTVEARLAQTEAQLAELTAQVEELRRQSGRCEQGSRTQKAAEFPLGGIVAWCVPLVAFLALMYVIAPPPALRGYLLIGNGPAKAVLSRQAVSGE